MKSIVNKITPAKVMQITNILRMLGLNTSHIGTKLINKFNIRTIKNNINNTLSNRNKALSKTNFEKIFGYEYYEKNFEPKVFIEEVSNLIK